MTKRDRINRILVLRRSGKTLQEIGDEMSLTRERIRQICADFGVQAPPRSGRGLSSFCPSRKRSDDVESAP